MMNDLFCCGRRRGFILLVVGLFLLSAGGCGWFSSSTKDEGEQSADALIQEGLDAYQLKKYERATEAFQKIKDRFPYSQYAVLAELKLADSYYLNKDYELAATSYKEFERMHPTNEVVAYAVFMQGMSYFKQMPTIDRDQSKALLAVQEFDRFVKSHPQSEYVTQAKINRETAQKNIVAHEFYIGEFYLKKRDYQAALGRFEGIISKYPQVPHPPKLQSYLQVCREKINTTKQKSDQPAALTTSQPE
jgi:outer membrane protein assembly factor BamD